MHNSENNNVEITRGTKTYHAPSLTQLGAIQSVVRNENVGHGGDANPPTNLGNTSAS